MTILRSPQASFNQNPMRWIMGLAVFVLFFVVLFYVAKSVFWLLSWVAPVLLILTLIVDYTVVLNYAKFIGNLFKNKWWHGIIAVILTFLAYPLVAGVLFGRAILGKKIKSLQDQMDPEFKRQNAEYSEYEEIIDEAEEQLKLKELKKEKRYDNLFD